MDPNPRTLEAIQTNQAPASDNIQIAPAAPAAEQGPPPGSVSVFRLSNEAEQAVKEDVGAVMRGEQPTHYTPERIGKAIEDIEKNLPLPRIPAWFWIGGIAVFGGIGYLAWRALAVTAPVLLPAALGLPPGSGLMLQQLMSNRGGAAPPAGFYPGREALTERFPMPPTQPGVPNLDVLNQLAPLVPLLTKRGSQTIETLSRALAGAGVVAGAAQSAPGATQGAALQRDHEDVEEAPRRSGRRPVVVEIEDRSGVPSGPVTTVQAVPPSGMQSVPGARPAGARSASRTLVSA